MKKMTAIFATLIVSSTVFASGALKMESYDCGLQMGKSLVKLSGTSAAQDAQNLSEDMPNYVAQSKLYSTLKKQSEKRQVEQAANNSWQSIVYSMDKITNVSPSEAAAINAACDLIKE